jgi:hypothetical protein
MVYEKIGLRYPEGDIYLERHKTREILEYDAIWGHPVINNIGVINFLKETLEAGFYIIAFLDEYFLSCKADFQKNHFIHESLVYGYSDEENKNVFYAISFNKNGAFTSLAFPYKEVEIGVTLAFEQDYSLFTHFYIIDLFDNLPLNI